MFEIEAQPVTDPKVDSKAAAARVTEFLALYQRFTAGTRWINRGYMDRGWTAGRHGFDPKFETDIKDFEIKVVEPMDRLWSQMTEDERTAAQPQKL